MILASSRKPARGGDGARRAGWFLVLGAAGLSGVAVVALIVAAVHVVPGRVSAPAGRQALSAYTSAIRPIFAGAGAITEMEMKPSIAAYDSGQLSGGELASRAAGWQVAFAGDRGRLGRLTVPPSLRGANLQFETAITGYGMAALWLQRAGQASDTDAARTDVSRAISAAQAADAVFDRGSAAVQAALRVAGLPADPDLPGAA